MATDEQRRKVAAELRELAANRHYVDEYIAADTVGFWRGEATEGFDSDSLLEVADLIDRPTCHLVEDEDGRTACSECGCTALYLLDATYCPDCGSIIERPR